MVRLVRSRWGDTPAAIEGGFLGAVDLEEHEPAFAANGLDPSPVGTCGCGTEEQIDGVAGDGGRLDEWSQGGEVLVSLRVWASYTVTEQNSFAGTDRGTVSR
jgi:hypothetical protein